MTTPTETTEREESPARRPWQRAKWAVAGSVLLVVLLAAGWFVDRQWNAGEITFRTQSADSPYLVGEVFDNRDQSVSGLFTVPMQQPMQLAAGSYRLRLTGSGRLSQDFLFNMQRDQRQVFRLDLDDGQLWPTLDVPSTYELADLEGRTDIILFDHDGVQRLDGSTCRELWAVDMDEIVEAGLQDQPGMLWQWTSHQSLSGQGCFDHRPMLLRPLPDVDGDQIGDLIWASRCQAWLLAQSGRDGSLLWFAPRGRELQDSQREQFVNRTRLSGAVVNQPMLMSDMDGDGVRDLVATFIDTYLDARLNALQPPRRWIEAISGATGMSIWQHDVPTEAFQLPPTWEPPREFAWFSDLLGSNSSHSSSSGAHGHYYAREQQASCLPRGASLAVPVSHRVDVDVGDEVLAVLAGTCVWGLDANSGETRWPAFDVHDATIRLPKSADLDGDGSPELILLGERPDVPGQPPSSLLYLTAWKPENGRLLWESNVRAPWHPYDLPQCTSPDWPICHDLDGDGCAEVIVPNGSSISFGLRQVPWGGLEVLDGATGRVRWKTRLANMDQLADRFVVGPDIDGDGCQDLLAASFSRLNSQTLLFVDAVSGKDGSRLWWTSTPLEFESPQFGLVKLWNAADSQDARLLVTVVTEKSAQPNDDRPNLFVFDGFQGRLEQTGVNMEQIRSEDCDGDGCVELYNFRPNDRDRSDRGGRLDAMRSPPPESWRALGTSREPMIADLDGDGQADLLEVSDLLGTRVELAARSGHDGRMLWQSHLGALGFQTNARVVDDLNGDGGPDILLYDATSGSSAGGLRRWPLQAVSGRYRHPMWKIDTPMRATAGAVLADIRDLNRDGRPEVIYVGRHDWAYSTRRRSSGTSEAELWLAVIDGQNGRAIWKQPLSVSVGKGTPGSTIMPFGCLQPVYADLDRDGTLDIVIPSEAMPNGMSWDLCAFSGVQGNCIWKQPLKTSQIHAGSPRMLAADVEGDSRPEIVLLEFSDNRALAGNNAEVGQIIVLDGTTGLPKWPAWQTNATLPLRVMCGFPDDQQRCPLPWLMRRGQGRTPAIAVAFWGRPGELIVLEPDGQEIMRMPLKTTPPDAARLGDLWTGRLFVADFTGDGVDELLLASDGEVRVIRPGEQDPLWRWSPPDASARASGQPDPIMGQTILVDSAPRIFDLLFPGQGHPDHIVVVRAGNSIYGLSAKDGQSLWRDSAALHDSAGGRDARPVRLLPGTDANGLRALRQLPNDVTVCWPIAMAKASPRPVAARSQVQRIATTRDPRYLRRLPWYPHWGLRQYRETIRDGLWGIVSLFVLVILPVKTLGPRIRKRRWTLRTMFLLTLLIALATTVLNTQLPLMSDELRTVGGRLGWMMAVTPVVSLAFLLFAYLREKSWRSAAGWLAASLVIALVLAAIQIVLQVSRYPFESGEKYSLEGWYLIWLQAVYLTGLGAVPVAVIRPMLKWSKSAD